MRPTAVLILLLRIFMGTSLLCSLAWIVDYSRQRGWHNMVGRNLLTKTAIISLLLLIGLLTSLFRFRPDVELVLGWVYVVLLAAIGPVMVWRMVVLHQAAAAVVRCPDGHVVSAGARYCPECGLFVREGQAPADS